jgi:hypothetical protein
MRCFCAVLAVGNERRAGRAVAFGAWLAAAGNLPLTVLEVRRDGPVGEQSALGTPGGAGDGARRVVLQDRDIGAQVADRVSGRDGALLVIDAHGGGPSGGRLFDVDAEHILERVRQPVVVVGPHAELPERQAVLMLPIDGGHDPDLVVRVVEAWTSTFGAADVMVIVLDAPDPWPPAASEGEEPLGEAASRALELLAERGVVASVRRLATVDAARSLVDAVDETRDAVLVLTAPRWPDGANHWFATVRRLIRHVACPVLVVPAT